MVAAVARPPTPPITGQRVADPGQERLPPDTQETHLSSPSLLSRTKDKADGVEFLPVTSTRGQGMTAAAAAFLPPETVGVHVSHVNAFDALDDASLVNTAAQRRYVLRKDTDGDDSL